MKRNILTVSSLAVLPLALTACLQGVEDAALNDGSISAPQITMDLPVSLSGVIESQPSSKVTNRATGDAVSCESHFDPHANFMENGYKMTRFLVGMSQMMSCQTDDMITNVMANVGPFIGQGVTAVPSDVTDPEAPTHFRVDQSGDTTKIWLMFATGTTPDVSTDPTIYLTWTTSGSDVSGQLFFINMEAPVDDPDAPEGVRVDFTRGALQDVNNIFLKMRSGHSGGMGGFRTQVVKKKATGEEGYEARGLITFVEGGTGNMFNLPAGETFSTPNFTASTVLDSTGAGGSIAAFNNFPLHLQGDDENADGTPDFHLGSYQFTLNHETYFANDATVEWSGKSTPAGIYVNTSGTNTRFGDNLTMFFDTFEGSTDLTYTDPDTQEEVVALPAMNLGAGYFTNTCTDTNGADCTDFVSGLVSMGVMGIEAGDSTDAKPTDARVSSLALVQDSQLTSVNPDGEDGSTTFDIPQP